MTFRNLPLRDVEAFFIRILGSAPNIHERSRRVVASIQLDACREPTGLSRPEERAVQEAIGRASSTGSHEGSPESLVSEPTGR